MDKKLLKENIKLTKETIISLEAMRVKNKEQSEKIEKDCLAGLEVNKFVLVKLEEELSKK